MILIFKEIFNVFSGLRKNFKALSKERVKLD